LIKIFTEPEGVLAVQVWLAPCRGAVDAQQLGHGGAQVADHPGLVLIFPTSLERLVGLRASESAILYSR